MSLSPACESVAWSSLLGPQSTRPWKLSWCLHLCLCHDAQHDGSSRFLLIKSYLSQKLAKVQIPEPLSNHAGKGRDIYIYILQYIIFHRIRTICDNVNEFRLFTLRMFYLVLIKYFIYYILMVNFIFVVY